MSVKEVTVQELEALMSAKADFVLLDVRNPDEYDYCNLGGKLIPLSELSLRMDELKRDQHIIVHCHAGGRSRRAVEFLMQQGFEHVENLKGGITAWANEIDPKMPKY